MVKGDLLANVPELEHANGRTAYNWNNKLQLSTVNAVGAGSNALLGALDYYPTHNSCRFAHKTTCLET